MRFSVPATLLTLLAGVKLVAASASFAGANVGRAIFCLLALIYTYVVELLRLQSASG